MPPKSPAGKMSSPYPYFSTGFDLMRRKNFMIEILKIVVRHTCKDWPITPELYYLETSPTYRTGAKDARNTVGPFIFFQIISFLKKPPKDNIYGTT